MFYTFSQNNSGGHYYYDEKNGITEYVIIEARSEKAAIRHAEDIGIYFDGVECGIDCECCGDRWYYPYFDCGTDVPQVYGNPVLEADPETLKRGFRLLADEDVVPSACAIHYLDGTIKWV